jgi:hypothetical protein
MTGQVFSESGNASHGVGEAAVAEPIVANTLDNGQSEHKEDAGRAREAPGDMSLTPPRIWTIDQVVRPGDHSRRARKFHKPCHVKSRSSVARDKPMERIES